MLGEPLFDEYREELLECRHYGLVAAVGPDGPAFSVGDASTLCWYRSASKPIQALPVLLRGLDKKYGLTDEEIAVMCSSHKGDEEHIRVITSILDKTGLKEADMCMQPTYPMRGARRDELIAAGAPPRRIYHNCSGKHAGMMLITRDAGGDVRDYWKRSGSAQRDIIAALEKMTDVPAESIRIGTDGCGVPVYAVPIRDMAKSYLRLICPELIADGALAAAARRAVDCVHAYPDMISGSGTECSILSADPNLIVKLGAQGVVCIGVRPLKIGAAVKILDGSMDEIAAAALRVLELFGYESEQTRLCREQYPDVIINDCGVVVGRREAVFELTAR